ncbi:MAG: zf-HC2 domain-containing protein [Candidatus Acidiferrum sp.]
MSCEQTETVLHGYFDNELDALGAAEFERHLAQCFDCTEALQGLKALRSSIGVSQLYEKTPAAFRKKVLSEVSPRRPVTIAPARRNWRWLAVAATLLLLAYGTWRIVSFGRADGYETRLAAEVIDAHLRSLQPGHLTDVVSTDQHTVKPWFDGKLDFSPPVRDFADQGFPLQGGRLDVVDNRAVAALVYGRRKHLVNVFIWPTNERDTAPRSGSRQGYQWVEWRKSGMEFCAVSDSAASDLGELQHLIDR